LAPAQPDVLPSLAGGLPAPELFPTKEIQIATEAVLSKRAKSALQYGETEGLAILREWIANRFRQALPGISAENVLITSGAQQAIDLMGRVLLDPWDRVLVENPTYLAALGAWRRWGVEFLGAPSDCDGACVDELPALLASKPKLAYCVPNFQNPQGATLSLERQLRLVELLRRLDVILIEDSPYGEAPHCQAQSRLQTAAASPSQGLGAVFPGRRGLDSTQGRYVPVGDQTPAASPTRTPATGRAHVQRRGTASTCGDNAPKASAKISIGTNAALGPSAT
jgi:DNA-binding transcriptional MocR family regulator